MMPFALSLALLLLQGCGRDDRTQEAAENNPEKEVALGRELYKRNGCPVCHGQRGRGDGHVARSLTPPPRDFRDLSAYQQGNLQSEIAVTLKNGVAVRTSAMPAYSHLSDAEAAALAAFVIVLQRQP